MAISARSRRGTSSSFWRNYEARQASMVQACMPSLRSTVPSKYAAVTPVIAAIQRPLPTTKVFIAQA